MLNFLCTSGTKSRGIKYLLEYEDYSVIEVKRNDLINLAMCNRVKGIKLCKYMNGFRVRNLKDNKTHQYGLSNKQKAEIYLMKCKAIGFNIEIDIINENEVQLGKIPNGTGRFIIPEFITTIGNGYNFLHTHYSEIVIQAHLESYKNLFYGMYSEHLRIIDKSAGISRDMFACFENCENLRELDISQMKTSNIQDISHAFLGCINLKDLRFSGIDTSSIKYANSVFCKTNISSIDISKLGLRSLESAKAAFGGCNNLSNIYIKPKQFPRLTHVDRALVHTNISKIDLSKIFYDLDNKYSIIDGCASLRHLKLARVSLDTMKFYINTSGIYATYVNYIDATNLYGYDHINRDDAIIILLHFVDRFPKLQKIKLPKAFVGYIGKSNLTLKLFYNRGITFIYN